MSSFADAALRRLLDVTVAGVLLVVLSPLLAVLALLVRATSPGPGFFRQTRIGRHGRPFVLLKLRTMRADAALIGPAITAGADARITPLGARLRRAKLDELPQLWNVLRGDMSLVGPRPELPQYVARYTPAQRAVLRARPGLTDPASLAWADEAAMLATFADPHRAYAQVVLPRKLALSLAYLERRTVWSDLAVVTRTAAHVARAALPAVFRRAPAGATIRPVSVAAPASRAARRSRRRRDTAQRAGRRLPAGSR
jgi:lipopolysaccharide/colanic/teichoic acid biosynthesis glycosyltransferase